jgi:hypothetical protein
MELQLAIEADRRLPQLVKKDNIFPTMLDVFCR